MIKLITSAIFALTITVSADITKLENLYKAEQRKLAQKYYNILQKNKKEAMMKGDLKAANTYQARQDLLKQEFEEADRTVPEIKKALVLKEKKARDKAKLQLEAAPVTMADIKGEWFSENGEYQLTIYKATAKPETTAKGEAKYGRDNRVARKVEITRGQVIMHYSQGADKYEVTYYPFKRGNETILVSDEHSLRGGLDQNIFVRK